ncbi:MAG TPA: efflux RND transporter periplasmic adaptor subunit [Rhodanobacteraceae bacterium]|jgi:RND family efflux transporter MFP subunit|nr:efflux RND transporter periplasmic adaptor subunit [Rhodanobacteraceae bacterium]
MQRAAIAVIALALLLVGCDHGQQAPEDTRPVQTLVVGQASESVGATYSGAVTARFQSNQGFRVTGTVLKRLVEVGQHVTANQPLLQLDPAQIDLNRQAAKAQLDAAHSQAAQAKLTLDRDAQLVKQNFISQAEYDHDKTNYDTATSQLQMAQAQYDQASNQASYGTLRAAVPGIVTAINADVGQVVDTGKAVLTIAQDGEREVVVSVPESRVDELRNAKGLYVTLWADPGKKYAARLREIDPDTDPTTRTYDAHVTVLEPDAAMLLGMTAYVHQPSTGRHPGFTLPLTAVVQETDGPAVWLVDPATSTVSLRKVKLLTAQGNNALVGSGLENGEVVVTAGANLLHAGQKVRPVGTYSQREQ